MGERLLQRKNVSSLSDTEKRNFIRAVLALKDEGVYDSFALVHFKLLKMMMSIHNGYQSSFTMYPYMCPAFLPWNREFCRRFEYNLQLKDTSVTLPYWDWAADAAIDNPANSPVWADDFMGGNGDPNFGNQVKDGPFAFDPSKANRWQIVDEDGFVLGGLKRAFGIALSEKGREPRLPTPEEVDAALQVVSYDLPPWNANSFPSFRNMLEGWPEGPRLHSQVHMWVGGTMMTGMAVFDPVYWLHHCNVDRIWAQWQDKNPEGYPPPGAIIDSQWNMILGQNIDDFIYPWNEATIRFNLDYRSNLKYEYD